MQKRFNTLLAPENRGGNLRPVSGASVTVTDPNGALATIYSDNGVTVVANPLTSNATGDYEYYAADGRYTETIVKAGRDTVTISDILLEDPADSPAPTSADMASTAANKGAGLVGFSALVEYAAGTVGKFLKDLVSSAGSALVGFIQSGTGAVERTVQDKLREHGVTLEDFGASAESTASENAAAFTAAVLSGQRIRPPQQAHTFDFAGAGITYTGTHLDIDLGDFKHTFIDFGGITANSLTHFKYNGRFSAADGYCKGLIRARNLQQCEIDTIEITDVYCDTPTSSTQFFALEYSSDLYADNTLSMTVNNAVFKDIITETDTVASGNAVAMTGFGNYGSASAQSQRHVLHFKSLYVENFYSVSSDGTTIIDGDSDFFRLFTNPTQLSIANLTIINVGKRFVKTQEACEVAVGNLVASLDARFTATNYFGTFEGQSANSGIPTRFTINHAAIDYATVAGGQPPFFSASGLPHEMYLRNAKFLNLSVYSASENIRFSARDVHGTGLNINAAGSSRISLERFSDSALVRVAALNVEASDFYIAPVKNTTGFPLDNAVLRNGAFYNVDAESRVAKVKGISNVSLTYSTGTVTKRPFQPVSSGTIVVSGLTVNGMPGLTTQTFESPGGGGTMIIRDYRSTNQTLAFFSTGTWVFRLDNCSDDTVTGAGATSVLRATYA